MIKFGTDGWRDIIADGFTFKKVGLATQAVVEYIKRIDDPKKGIVVGFDTRFLSKEFAHHVATVLSANDIPVFLGEDFAPTPAVSYLAKKWNTKTEKPNSQETGSNSHGIGYGHARNFKPPTIQG